ncbi:MAG: transporter substrate-binding domain-containing protein [Opitutaceae bacterium]
MSALKRFIYRLASHQVKLFLIASVLWVYLSGTSARADDIGEIIQKKILRVAIIDKDTPPFLVVSKGVPQGLEGDLLVDLARRLGVQLQLVRTAKNVDQLIEQVSNSEVDLAIGQLTSTLEWSKSVRFSKPYLTLQELVLTDRLVGAKAGGVDKLLKKRESLVTAISGTAASKMLEDQFGNRLKLSSNLDIAVQQLLAGKTAAVIADEVTIINWLKENPEAGVRVEVTNSPLYRPTLNMAINIKFDDLKFWMNVYMEKWASDGTMDMVMEKNFGKAQSNAKK